MTQPHVRVPQQPYIPLKERLHWRRLVRFYAEEARISDANGDTGEAKIYRQSIASMLEWIGGSEEQ